jgi:acetyl-CoA carboxylase alpha subunit
MAEVRRALLERLDELAAVPTDELVPRRRRKFRRMGVLDGRFGT